jgi:hypothetical protein
VNTVMNLRILVSRSYVMSHCEKRVIFEVNVIIISTESSATTLFLCLSLNLPIRNGGKYRY